MKIDKTEIVNIIAEIYNDYKYTAEYQSITKMIEAVKVKNSGICWQIFNDIFILMKYTIQEYSYKYNIPITHVTSSLESVIDNLYILYLESGENELQGYIQPKIKAYDYIDTILYEYIDKTNSNIKITSNYSEHTTRQRYKNNTENKVINNIQNNYYIDLVGVWLKTLSSTECNIIIDTYKHGKSINYISVKYKLEAVEVTEIITEVKERLKNLIKHNTASN